MRFGAIGIYGRVLAGGLGVKIVIAKGSVKRSIDTPFCMMISADNLDQLIEELQAHQHRWKRREVSYGAIGISGDIDGMAHVIPNSAPDAWEEK